jgi:dihydrofolate reductase
MLVEAIMGLDLNNGLAKNGEIPWKSKTDMMFFKNKTKNNIIIMGLKTFLSLPNSRPLTNRENIVITNNIELYSELYKEYSNYLRFVSLDEAKDIIYSNKNKQIFIIGGKQIYEIFLPICSNIWITKIKKDYDCDLLMNYNLTTYNKILFYSDDELDIFQYVAPGRQSI